jgi:hypothetical protein
MNSSIISLGGCEAIVGGVISRRTSAGTVSSEVNIQWWWTRRLKDGRVWLGWGGAIGVHR